MSTVISKSEKQTFNFGKNLAKKIRGGNVIALIGELGSGKTVLIKGIAAGLGIKKHITSPTFVLMKVYPVRSSSKGSLNRESKGEAAFAALINLKKKDIHKTSNGVYPINNQQSTINNFVHIDAYRLSSGQDLIDIGLNDWLGRPDTVTVIEWADRVNDILPKNVIIVKIKTGNKKNERKIKINKYTNQFKYSNL